MFLINADYDMGLRNQTIALENALKEYDGNSVTSKVYPGTNHVSIIGLVFAKGRPNSELIQDSVEWMHEKL